MTAHCTLAYEKSLNAYHLVYVLHYTVIMTMSNVIWSLIVKIKKKSLLIENTGIIQISEGQLVHLSRPMWIYEIGGRLLPCGWLAGCCSWWWRMRENEAYPTSRRFFSRFFSLCAAPPTPKTHSRCLVLNWIWYLLDSHIMETMMMLMTMRSRRLCTGCVLSPLLLRNYSTVLRPYSDHRHDALHSYVELKGTGLGK